MLAYGRGMWAVSQKPKLIAKWLVRGGVGGQFPRNVDSYFEKGCRKKCARQSRKVIWDMIDTLFLTTVAVEPTFVAFL